MQEELVVLGSQVSLGIRQLWGMERARYTELMYACMYVMLRMCVYTYRADVCMYVMLRMCVYTELMYVCVEYVVN